MTMYTIPPHRPDAIRLLLPTDEVVVIPLSVLAPATRANLADALRAAAGDATAHAAQLRRYLTQRQAHEDHEPTE